MVVDYMRILVGISTAFQYLVGQVKLRFGAISF